MSLENFISELQRPEFGKIRIKSSIDSGTFSNVHKVEFDFHCLHTSKLKRGDVILPGVAYFGEKKYVCFMDSKKNGQRMVIIF